MSILSGYGKFKRYVLTDSGYKLCSQWTSSNTVQFDDGNTAQTKLGAINGITDSLTATSSNVALSAKSGKSLQDQITLLNTDLTSKLRNLSLLADTREDGAASKALNIVSSHAAYRSTTYFVLTTRANRIIHVLVVQGYTSNTTMTGIDLGVVRLYEDADYPISATTAIAENSTVRVKIAMATADKSYRSFIIPLGTGATNGTASYSASWATS